MTQEVLFLAPVQLFELKQGTTTERGNATCAIVCQNGTPPRYKVVCYNDQRQTLCAATLTSSNEHSLQFRLQANEYCTLRDDQGVQYSLLFSRSGDVDRYCAHLGAAFFGASGQPSHSTVIADFAHAAQRGGKVLDLGKRGKARYVAYTLTRGETTSQPAKLKELLQTNGDMLYPFDAVQSAFNIPEEGRGFESSATGMIAGTARVVVVPDSLPSTVKNPTFAGKSVVFVVHLERVLDDPTLDPTPAPGSSALVPAAAAPAPAPASQLVVAAAAEPMSTALALPADLAASPPPVEREAMPSVGAAAGGGIPAEHMLLVQKLAGQINAATTTLRDLQDKVEQFNGEWKQTTTRPKPSVLSNEALDQGVKQLIMESERTKDEVARRDEIIRAIEDRNRELQKRVDKSAMVAQQMLDEKKEAAMKTGDVRLDLDRQVMKLQEQISRATAERDDVQRHLTTVKKLLDMSDSEQREVKGKLEISKVQLQGVQSKLEAEEDQLGEERSRRKAFEAKCASVQEEIRNVTAEVHLKQSQVEDITRKAESERLYHMGLLEEERHRRSNETTQLRTEIIGELEQREEKFQGDRARAIDDHYARGREEGRGGGRQVARVEVESRMQELVLDAQRAKTELDAYKTTLREAQDDAMAENRRLEAMVAALKVNCEEATKIKAQNEFRLHNIQAKLRAVEDHLLLGMTNVAYRLTTVAPPAELAKIVDSLNNNEQLNMDFLKDVWAEDERDTRSRREEWMADHAAELYEQALDAAFEEASDPLHKAREELHAEIARLWDERDLKDVAEAVEGETQTRHGLDADQEAEWAEIVELYEVEAKARAEVEEEEVDPRIAVDAEYDAFVLDFADFIERLADERTVLCEEETAPRLAVEAEYAEFAAVFVEFAEKLAAEREALCTEEEGPRAEIEAEFDVSFIAFGEFLEQLAADREASCEEEVAPRAEIEAEFDLSFVALGEFIEQLAGERIALCVEEEEQRAVVAAEEDAVFREAKADAERALFEGIIAEQQVVIDEEEAARAEAEKEIDEAVVALESEVAEAAAAAQALQAEREQLEADARNAMESEEATARDATAEEADVEFEAMATEERSCRPHEPTPEPSPVPTPKAATPEAAPAAPTAEADELDLEEEGGAKAAADGAPRAAESTTPSPPTETTGAAKPTLFAESDEDEPKAAPKPAMKRAARLQDTDSDEEPIAPTANDPLGTGLAAAAIVADTDSDDDAPPPRPAPKPAARSSHFDNSSGDEGAAPRPSGTRVSASVSRPAASAMFGSDSDDDVAPPPRPGAKRVIPKPAAKGANLFASSDDD